VSAPPLVEVRVFDGSAGKRTVSTESDKCGAFERSQIDGVDLLDRVGVWKRAGPMARGSAIALAVAPSQGLDPSAVIGPPTAVPGCHAARDAVM